MINEKNDYGLATGLLQESLVLAQEVRDTERALQALCNLGYAALMQGDYERVTTLCGEALTTARDAEGGGMWHIPETLIDLGLASLQLGSYKQADATFKEALTMAREVGIKPEVRHQVPRRPQGRHGPDQRPGRVLDHSEGRSSAGGPRGLRAHRRAGAHRGVDRRPGVRDQQGGQPGGGSEAVGLREPRSRAALDRGGEERPVVREPPVRGRW
jgi:tetratricopeptide (TPR) repeat protein